MKNKLQIGYLQQQGIPKQNFFKKRNQHNYQNKLYHSSYKPNLTQNNYYDKPYWKDNYVYIDYTDRGLEPRPYYKKKNWYNNYKKQHDLEYDEEDSFHFTHQYSERNRSPQNKVVNTNPTEIKRKETPILTLNFLLAGQFKKFFLYKGDDVSTVINKFCLDNNLDAKLSKALVEKINSSFKSIEAFRQGVFTDKNIELINKIQKLYEPQEKE